MALKTRMRSTSDDSGLGRNRLGRTVLLVFLLTGSSTTFSRAQDAVVNRRPHHHRVIKISIDDRVLQMTKQLDLTEVQQHELKELLEGERDQEARLRTQPSLSPIQRTDRLRALRERNVSRFEEILTTEQRRRYEEFRAEAGGFLPTKSD